MDTSRDLLDIKTRAKAAYDATEVIWPETDRWSIHTRDFLQKTLTESVPLDTGLLLNAGCGANDYGVSNSGECVNLDISLRQTRIMKWPVVGDIESLPFEDECFDLVICVGAIINYCEPYAAIPELARVLKKGGRLILDFETTTTAEILFTSDWGKRVSVIERLFADRMDKTYLFSPHHVRTIVAHSNCEVLSTLRYHTATAIWRRVFPSSKLPRPVLLADGLASVLPGVRIMASNVIFVCQKLEPAHQSRIL